MLKRLALTALIFAGIGLTATHADSIVGRWKSIDDVTGKARSVVELYEQDGKICGRIVELLLLKGDNPNPTCELCPGKRKDQPVRGMVILEGLEKKGSTWVNGEILDPDDGKIYRCKAWVEDGNLQLRGYVSIFFRTQTWLPAGE